MLLTNFLVSNFTISSMIILEYLSPLNFFTNEMNLFLELFLILVMKLFFINKKLL